MPKGAARHLSMASAPASIPHFDPHQGVMPEASLAGFCAPAGAEHPERWCAPGERWCEYHGSDPALATYVEDEEHGWERFAKACLKHEHEKAEEATRRALLRQAYTGESIHHPKGGRG